MRNRKQLFSGAARFMPSKCIVALAISLTSGLLAAQSTGPTTGLHDATFTATLLSPMSSETSRKGDHFTAAVQSPARYRGAVLTGVITESKQPSKGFAGLGARKNAEMSFQFETLTYRNIQYPVSVNLTGVSNKQGIKGVDDEGHVIGTTSEKKPIMATMIGAGTGALVGGLTHMGVVKGTAIGAGAGLLIGMTMTTQAESITMSGKIIAMKAVAIFLSPRCLGRLAGARVRAALRANRKPPCAESPARRMPSPVAPHRAAATNESA